MSPCLALPPAALDVKGPAFAVVDLDGLGWVRDPPDEPRQALHRWRAWTSAHVPMTVELRADGYAAWLGAAAPVVWIGRGYPSLQAAARAARARLATEVR